MKPYRKYPPEPGRRDVWILAVVAIFLLLLLANILRYA